MQATREDFELFLTETKKVINDKNIDNHTFYDFKDYTEFVHELKEFLKQNSTDKWQITTDFGIGIQRV